MSKEVDVGGALPRRQAGGRTQAKDKRRATLLDTAQTVFLEKGYEATTVNDILDAAGLSKGGFYHHFKSKDDVLDALRVRYTRRFLCTVEARVAALPADAMQERFQEWIRAYLDAYFATYTVHDLVYHSVHWNRSSEDREAVIASVARLLEQGMTQGAWRLAAPKFTATLIYAAIHGMADEAIASRTDNPPEVAQRLHAALRLLLAP
ncbi:TetR/AcrR family transcriptional regulator [Desulfolutivibrio sp.]|uniref:TetR/AcrR family transcriptional regulator n=1 Tax=Desulfolutivibrio sp. TaxID=2773296 RepID=UPI002F969B75